MLTVVSILLDAISYGMVLFTISIGLSIMMGLMRVVNLAHGAFAMIGASRIPGGAFAMIGASRVPAAFWRYHCGKSNKALF